MDLAFNTVRKCMALSFSREQQHCFAACWSCCGRSVIAHEPRNTLWSRPGWKHSLKTPGIWQGVHPWWLQWSGPAPKGGCCPSSPACAGWPCLSHCHLPLAPALYAATKIWHAEHLAVQLSSQKSCLPANYPVANKLDLMGSCWQRYRGVAACKVGVGGGVGGGVGRSSRGNRAFWLQLPPLYSCQLYPPSHTRPCDWPCEFPPSCNERQLHSAWLLWCFPLIYVCVSS